MKKNIYTPIILMVLLSALFMIFISCEQGVIFYDIEHEVEYTAPSVSGNVYSMVPCKGVIFTQNNQIYRKGWAEGGQTFKNVNKPVDGYAVKVASDADYLYVLMKTAANDETGTVYTAAVDADGTLGSWNLVKNNVLKLFDNQVYDIADGTTTGRNAYFTTSEGVCKLNGTAAPDAPQAVTDIITSESKTSEIQAAVSDGTTDSFSSLSLTVAMTSGATTYFYYANGSTVSFRTASATEWTVGTSLDSVSIRALAPDKAGSRLLVGTQYSGLKTSTVSTSDGKPGSLEAAGANASTAFGTRCVIGTWAYGASGTCYAAIMDTEHSDYNKLYGYYSSRDNWNYE